jgi:hypothetical protein
MLPEHFYFTGVGWLGYMLYVPVALLITGLVYWLFLRRVRWMILRLGVLLMLSLTLTTLPLWEAAAISFEAEALCANQGGLHVYKTVEAEGFLGGGSIEYGSKYGFSYLEVGGANKKNSSSP